MLEHGERRIQLPGNVNPELFLGKQANDTAHIPLCVAKREREAWIGIMGVGGIRMGRVFKFNTVRMGCNSEKGVRKFKHRRAGSKMALFSASKVGS